MEVDSEVESGGGSVVAMYIDNEWHWLVSTKQHQVAKTNDCVEHCTLCN